MGQGIKNRWERSWQMTKLKGIASELIFTRHETHPLHRKDYLTACIFSCGTDYS